MTTTYQRFKYTEKGQAYLELDYRSAHRVPLSWWGASLIDIEATYGRGIRMYFSFSKFLLYVNALIALIALFTWCSYIKDMGPPFQWSYLFVSSYPIDSSLWIWTNVIVLMLCFLVGPIYYAWECSDAPIESRDVVDDTIHSGTTLRYQFGYIVGALFTVTYLALGAALLYGLILVQKVNPVLSIIVSVGFAGLVQTWNFLSYVISYLYILLTLRYFWNRYKVTEREHNLTWFAFRMSQSVKLIGYKIMLASSLYVLMAFILPCSTHGECEECVAITNSGVQFFLIILFDFLATLALQLCLPLVRQCCCADSADGPEFNIAENLLLLSYRQFILYIGVLVFPLLGTMIFCVNLVQYLLDRARLMRICRDTHYIPETPVLFLMGFMLNAAITATFTYPNGAMWILFFPRLLPTGFQNCTMVAGRL